MAEQVPFQEIQETKEPKDETIRAYRWWYDHPLSQITGLRDIASLLFAEPPQNYPQEGVEAVPFMGLGDPFSMLLVSKGMQGALNFKGLKSNFKDAKSFLDYIDYIKGLRELEK